MLWKLPTTREIATIRKQLGISQYRLAKNAKVSQAMINKFEREQVDMGYSKVIRVCAVLAEAFSQQLQKSTNMANLCAEDIMEQKVTSVTAADFMKLARASKR
jgi:predicted transcriptional regulator